MSNAILTLDRISCSYKIRKNTFRFQTYHALNEISLDIFKGETLGIVGSNGAGKSTLLKIIAGIIVPNAGNIISHKNLSISLLSLQLGFSPELSGFDNAIMGALLLGYSKNEAKKHLDEIIEFSELGKRIDDPMKTYSTGMKARLGFAVAMKMSPDILLVDEALGVGDAKFRAKSTKAMKEKLVSGQTVVFVSHQAPTIKELCTRVVWIEHGEIMMTGDPEDVLNHYKNNA